MENFLNTVLWPSLYAFLGILATKLFDYVKPKFQQKIDNADARQKEAEAKAQEIENAGNHALFLENLLQKATEKLEAAIKEIEKRDQIIKEQDLKIKERDKKIDHLLEEVENLTTELKKFKQLNGKA